MANIIIMGENQPTKSKAFRPHFNHAMGKYISSKAEYLETMKKMNLVPYEGEKPEKEVKYKPSQWVYDMAKPKHKGSVYYKELEKRGYSPKKIRELREEALKGGKR